MAMQVPTVTVDDLHAFRAKHFPSGPYPAQFFYSAFQATDEVPIDEDDDGLGYYEDGTKRTLTEEQIALFRHTEIQTILRERRRKREAENEAAEASQTRKDLHIALSDPEEDEPLKSDSSQAEEDPVDDASVNTSSAATPSSAVDGVQDGRVDKDNRYRRLTKDKQRRKNIRYKRAQKQKKAEEKKKRREGSVASAQKDGDESDEWDPWHQANGPDAQKADAVDLDY